MGTETQIEHHKGHQDISEDVEKILAKRVTWLYWLGWTTAFLFAKLFLRMKVEGEEFVPKSGGAILASNHASFFDPPLLGSSTKRMLFYLAKRELFNYPILGQLISRVNSIPINRTGVDRFALRIIMELIKREHAAVLFPEGTRTKDGKLGQGKAGLGMIAFAVRKPIIPVYISGTYKIWRSLLGLKRVKIKFGKPILLEDLSLSGDKKTDYQTISDEVMKQISAIEEEQRDKGSKF